MTDMLSSAPVWRFVESIFIGLAIAGAVAMKTDAITFYLVVAIFCEVRAQRSENPSDHE